MYKSGLSAYKISERTGIPPHQVYKILRRANISRRGFAESLRKLAVDQEQELVRLYKTRWGGINKLARRFGLALKTVVDYLDRNNIKRRASGDTLTKLRTPTQKNLAKYYKQGYNLEECGRKFGISRSLAGRIVGKYGKARLLRHRINKRYFQRINTCARAYWFGFLCADGYAKRSAGGNYHITVSLQARDINHLLNFRKALDSEHPISRRIIKLKGKRFRGVVFNISCKEMVEDLHNNGLYKFKNDQMPRIAGRLLTHFWRGVYDGDGTIGFYQKRRDRKGNLRPWNRAIIGLVGDKSILENLRSTLWRIANRNKIHNQGSIHAISWAGCRQVERIATWLYSGSSTNILLNRKCEVFKRLKAHNARP